MIHISKQVSRHLPAYAANLLTEAAATYSHEREVGYPPRVRAIDVVISKIKRDHPKYFKKEK